MARVSGTRKLDDISFQSRVCIGEEGDVGDSVDDGTEGVKRELVHLPIMRKRMT